MSEEEQTIAAMVPRRERRCLQDVWKWDGSQWD